MKIHQILTSKELTYDFYLSALSALETHKPEEYNLWTFGEPTGEYFKHIAPRVVLREIGLDLEEFAAYPCFADKDENFVLVHLKDVLAWKILYEEGGLFMDLDTLSIQDCTSYFDSCKNVFLFRHGNGGPATETPRPWFNVAAMMAQAKTPLMWEIYNAAMNIVQGDTIAWGDTGPTLLNNILAKYPDSDMFDYLDEFCVVDGHGYGKLREVLSEDGFIWDSCKILHIYRSCPYTQDMMAATPFNEEFIYKSQSPYARMIKRILKVRQWNPNNIRQPAKTVRSIKTFHLPCLAHLAANKADSLSCAFTQKTLKMATMLKSLGHKVIAYGIEGSEIECDEFVQVASKYDLLQSFGERNDLNRFYSMDRAPIHDIFDENAIREINRRKTGRDFLLCTFGWGHKSIADGVQIPLTVESGIGYMDTFAKYRVFESSAWMHYIYGRTQQGNGGNYDAVIPNYFDVNDFEYSDTKEDYFLMICRLIARKGLEEAMQIAAQTKTLLKVVGQQCGENINLDREYVEYVGYAGVEKRKELLKNAKALFVPTRYIGPFEGVHVEAGLSGTPVITSDWGVFNEAVLHGITGYRCRTFDQYVWAAENISNIRPIDCYNYATQNYSMERVKWMYEEYFDMLLDIVVGSGWYERHLDRGDYDAWKRHFPS